MCRVIKDIPKGVELLVYYGDSYAKQLGIRTDELDRFPGKEDHRWEGSTCQHCNTTFSTVEYLNEHLGQDGGMLTCKVKRKTDRGEAKAVPAASGTKTAVKRDQRQPVVCPECHKTFSRPSNLRDHRRVVHEKKQRFKCPDCGKLFGQKGVLDRHVSTVHKNVRLFVCGICQKAFGHKSVLKTHHKEVHDGQKRAREGKKHPCPVCGSLFYYPAEVKRHVESLHPEVAEEEKKAYEEAHPFPCSRCGKRFATKEEKGRHEKKLH